METKMKDIIKEKSEIEEILEEQKEIEEEKVDKFISNLFKFFEGLQRGMSAFQIKNFVLSKEEFPTESSQFWQCKSEIYVRMKSLFSELIKLKRLKLEFQKLRSADYTEETKIDLLENKFQRFINAMRIKELMRETSVFLEVLNDLEESLPEEFIKDKELSEPKTWALRTKWKSMKRDWLKNMPLDYLKNIQTHGGDIDRRHTS